MTGVAAADVAASCAAVGSGSAQATEEDGTNHVYGDRHQYTKMATLLTHLGLILFLVAAVVTSRFGDEQGLVVPEGESLTVQPIGTPGLLLVKNLALRGAGLRHRHAVRLHDGSRGLPRRRGDRAQDDPGQRPAVGRWVHVPPERVRAGAASRDPRRCRQAAVGRPGAARRIRPRARRTGSSPSPAATSVCSCCWAATARVAAWSSSCPYRVVGTNRRQADPAELRAGQRSSAATRGCRTNSGSRSS